MSILVLVGLVHPPTFSTDYLKGIILDPKCYLGMHLNSRCVPQSLQKAQHLKVPISCLLYSSALRSCHSGAVWRERKGSSLKNSRTRWSLLTAVCSRVLLTSGEHEDRHLFREPHRRVKCAFPSSDQSQKRLHCYLPQSVNKK